ncbi:MAG: hypothetical protein F6K31_36610 [Symploca sp. SIO2G7]|nr:hypothetical protein [Symploca sp. SIO2G7]
MVRLQMQVEQRDQLKKQIIELKPLCQQQTYLETERQELMQQQQVLIKLSLHRQSLQDRLAQLDRDLQQNNQELRALEVLQSSVESIPNLEQQQQRWQQQLSRVEAAKQFKTELQQLVSRQRTETIEYDRQAAAALESLDDLQQSLPLLSSDVIKQLAAAIATGQTLSQTTLSALESILSDLAKQVDVVQLKQKIKTGQTQLKKAYGHQAQLAKQEQLQQKQAELMAQQQQLQTTMVPVDQQLAQTEPLSHRLRELEQAIDTLDNPEGRYQVLQEQLQTITNVEAEYERLQTQNQTLETALADLASQVASFADLDLEIAQQQRLHQDYQTGYLTYIQHEKDAEKLGQLTADLATINHEITVLNQNHGQLARELTRLAHEFDPQALSALEQQYVAAKSEGDRITGSLPQQRKLQDELASQLNALQQVAEKRVQAQIDLKHKERVKRFINFARKAYKEAGPRITERYVQGISQEADRLFRDLLNRPNVALEWTRDYEIIVQEGGNTRRFINLSGGEQMCAALAVRLALLKVLADIDIAFFDEPTTNMDRPRRESLAEAIAGLKAFKQLFVISHDDTFEKVTENVIIVDREY